MQAKSDEQGERPVRVRMAVYEIGRRIDELAGMVGEEPYMIAGILKGRFAGRGGGKTKVKLWEEIYEYLQWQMSVGWNVPTVLIPDRKPGKRRKR